MSESSARDVVAQFYRAFGTGEVAAIAALLANDVRWQVGGPPSIPWAGVVTGRYAALASIAAWRGAIESIESQRGAMIADGDAVVVTGTGRYRMRATGKEVDDRWVHVWRVAGGWIVAFDEYSDTAAAARATE